MTELDNKIKEARAILERLLDEKELLLSKEWPEKIAKDLGVICKVLDIRIEDLTLGSKRGGSFGDEKKMAYHLLMEVFEYTSVDALRAMNKQRTLKYFLVSRHLDLMETDAGYRDKYNAAKSKLI